MILFGYFDFLIVAILLYLNIKWFGKINWKIGCWIGGVLFGFILPFISMIVELEVVKRYRGGWMDSFEVAYTYLRFPTYWVLGIIQVIIIGMRTRKK